MTRVVRLQTLGDSRLDAYARLTERQLRCALDPSSAQIVAESRNVVEVALRAGLTPISFLVDEAHLAANEDLFSLAAEDVPVFVLPADEIERLAGFKVTRGPLACLRRPVELTVEQALDCARHVAVLEDLVDVTNVGAIFRSAAALGADAVLLSPRCADPLCRRALRVSMGTVLQVPWARCEAATWPDGLVADLHERGFACLAMALADDAVAIDAPELAGEGACALFFGCEGWGLTEPALAACDRSVIIPMTHGVDSLNVAASSAVAFWQLFR